MDQNKKPPSKFVIQMEIVPYKNSHPLDIVNTLTSTNFNTSKSHPLHDRMKVRILYKGKNRNGSYIDDNVEQLIIDTLPNTPIVGEYWEIIEDFGTHGLEIRSNEKGDLIYKRTTIPYGVVPADTEIWHELVTDKDGVERNYLCAEVILWTKRYPELIGLIDNGRPQSMELDEDTIFGNWVEEENGYDYYFRYTQAFLSALCILGTDIEPCFEGASFVTFSAQNGWSDFKKDCQEMFNDIKANYEIEVLSKKIESMQKIVANFNLDNISTNNSEEKYKNKYIVFTTGLNLKNKGGKFNMGEIKLKFSNTSDIRETIYKNINGVSSEGDVYDFKYSITEVKNDHFLAFNYQDNKYYKFNYSISGDELKIDQPVSIYAEFPSKEDKEKTDTAVRMFSIKEAEIVKLTKELREVKDSIKDYNLSKDEYESIKSDADNFNNVKNELDTLRAFREKTEKQSKLDILEKFAVLGETELKVFKDNLSKYTADELDEKLSVIAFRKNIVLNKEEEVISKHTNTFSIVEPKLPNFDSNVPNWFAMVKEQEIKMLNVLSDNN